jgi:hypothetical protein
MSEAIKLQLGNVAPLHTAAVDGALTTFVDFPDGISVDEAFITVTDPSGLWAAQSSAPAAWVACSDSELQARLCSFFSCQPLAVAGLNA